MADTLTSGSHPNSNRPGRRREDDTNIVAFHATQDPISDTISPALSRGNAQGCATVGVHTATAVRRLTPTECERLQGFPDDWTLPGSDTSRYARCGNAVTVPVAEWIGHRLAMVDEG